MSFALTLEQTLEQPVTTTKPPGAPPQNPSSPFTSTNQMVVHPDAEKRGRREPEHDLDPATRQAAQLAPPLATPKVESASVAAQTNAQISLEDLVPALVKKIAWTGDAHRGTVRMELGSGELAGSTLTVSADHGRVSVHVRVPAGTDAGAWRSRLATRLEARGLSVESVEIT